MYEDACNATQLEICFTEHYEFCYLLLAYKYGEIILRDDICSEY